MIIRSLSGSGLLSKVLLSMPLNVMKKLFFTILFFIALTLSPFTLKAQNSSNDYEEISVFLAVQGIGGYDITAIYKNNEIYIPVTDMFQALKINQKLSEFNDTLSGFFLYENNKYIISQLSHTVFVNGKLIQLSDNELFSTETSSLALRLDQYGKLFGLDCRFTFSSLMVELKTSHELPVIKELRLEQMRKNISRLRGEITVDTTYQRKYHILKGGMADWAVYSTQLNNGPSETRALLGLGAEFLGGETNIELNYSSKYNFEKRQQQYHWRWANNNTKLVKQVTVGKISSRSVASIYSPLIGTVITNTPTTYRRSFGSYTMSDFTEPGWTVELYINNIIVDFTTADAFGFFKFDIPLVYGASNVLIKFYGPWGEERTKEQIINVPFNFLPAGELQYSIAGAMVQDTSHSFFSRGEANFGISRHLTLGGGLEYLSSISASPSIPFVNGSAQIFSNLLVNAEYAHGVRTKALVSYSLPSNFVFDIDYTKYALEQKAITFNYREERKIRVSIPVSLKKIKAYSRFAYIQNILKETTYSTAEATISTFYKGVSANFTGNANWLGKTNPYIYGNLALGFRFFRTLSFRPQVQYDFSNKDLIYTKVELENNFSPKCNLALNWENNIRNNINSVELTLRYDLSFAQTSISTRISDQYIMTGQSARGSFAFGSGNARIIADRRTQVGRAGLTIIPFLDINNNNRHDDNEPVLSGMNVRINGGRILPNSRDSIIRILDLEPFASYMLEFSDTQFDNIAWQIPNKTLSILMDPNQFKLLEIPIKIMGEINGMIYIKSGNNLKPQGRILINIFDHKGNFIAKTQSESDGYFNYIGLAPGSYYAEIDSLQLSRLKSIPYPSRYDFNIHPSENGDIIDNIEFQLEKRENETQGMLNPDIQPKSADPSGQKLNMAQQTNTTDQSLKTEKIAEPPVKAIIPEVKSAAKAKADNTSIIETASAKNNKSSENSKPVKVNTESIHPDTDINHQSVLSNDATPGKYYIQACTYIAKSRADKYAAELLSTTSKEWFVVYDAELYKVRLGYFATRNAAMTARINLKMPATSFYIDKIK